MPSDDPTPEPTPMQVLLDRAAAAQEKGDVAQVQREVEAALAIDPGNADAIGFRGWVHFSRHDFDLALSDFDRALGLSPDDPEHYWWRGTCRHSLGDDGGALEDFHRASELDPEMAEAYSSRAAIHMARNEHEAAIEAYSESLRCCSDNVWDLFYRGCELMEVERHAEAIADFTGALNLKNGWLLALVKRGKAFASLGRLNEARADLEAAIRLPAETAAEFCFRGGLLSLLGEEEKAIADHTEEIRLNPDSPVGYYNRGWSYLTLGRLDEAIADADRALEIHPGYPLVFLLRGRALLKKEQPRQALTDLDTLIQLDPADAIAWSDRGHAHAALEEYDEAILDHTREIELTPTSDVSYVNRGMMHYNLDDYDRCIDDFDQAIRLQPCASSFKMRGDSYRRLDCLEEALADLNRAIILDPNDDDAYYARAKIHQDIGDLDLALADMAVALDLGPEQAVLWYWRGTIWEDLEEFDKARSDYDEAIRLAPLKAHYFDRRAGVWDVLKQVERADADYAEARRLESAEEDHAMTDDKLLIYNLVREHFQGAAVESLNLTDRNFPFRVAADIQLALDGIAGNGFKLAHFQAIERCSEPGYEQPVRMFAELFRKDRRAPVVRISPRYQEMDIGEEQPVRCLRTGLWLLEHEDARFGVLLDTSIPGNIRFQVAAPEDDRGRSATSAFFRHLEVAIEKSRCYRGKILSLECKEAYSGQAYGILVHKLRPVVRDEVILPRQTLDLLDRNVIRFIQHRSRLAEAGLPTKKGLLFYGPPGTGKTHTIHYLAGATPGQTTFLVSAEEVGNLSEYLTLARLFQPSMVVIEDVDLIARHREQMRSATEEVLLNKLLNEMDGLRQDAEIVFVLTTNRPEALEEALSARPGRIDQAIEFPLPNAEGRAKLVRLYSRRLDVPEDVVETIVKRTDRVTASFIKELMRRAAQFRLERADSGPIIIADVESALEELLFAGGSLNRKLLGASASEIASRPRPPVE